MTIQKYTGSWYIPGGQYFPGQLSVDNENGKILLEVYGSVYLDGSAINFGKDHLPDYLDYIYGQGGHAGPTTLYRCNWAGTSMIGENLYLTKYSAKYIVYGAHLSGTDEPKVLSGKFSFPYLGSFYDGWESMNLVTSDLDYNEIDKVYTQTLIISDELKLDFISYLSRYIADVNVSFTIEKYEYLVFKYHSEVPFSRLIKDAANFRRLLCFSYGKPTIFKIHVIEIDHAHLANKVESCGQQTTTKFRIANFSMSGNKEISKSSSHQNHMLVSKWKMSRSELDAVIIKWFENKKLANIYEYYLDSNNWFQGVKEAKLSIVMFNNRFLNLIQGLEDYYREFLESPITQKDRQEFLTRKNLVLASIKDAELKHWVNDKFKAPQYATLEEKLQTIIDKYAPVIEIAFPAIKWDTFPRSAKDHRNLLSHGKNKEIDLGEQLNLDYHLAQLLICICILYSLDIQNIPALIKLNMKLQRTYREIRHRQSII